MTLLSTSSRCCNRTRLLSRIRRSRRRPANPSSCKLFPAANSSSNKLDSNHKQSKYANEKNDMIKSQPLAHSLKEPSVFCLSLREICSKISSTRANRRGSRELVLINASNNTYLFLSITGFRSRLYTTAGVACPEWPPSWRSGHAATSTASHPNSRRTGSYLPTFTGEGSYGVYSIIRHVLNRGHNGVAFCS